MTRTWLHQGRRAVKHALPEKRNKRNRRRTLDLEPEEVLQGVKRLLTTRGQYHSLPWYTHASNEWCMAFQLSLRDGVVHWHRALSRKKKRTWSLLSDKLISYYCSQFSQSARTRYYRAKRLEKEHISD
ncbi:hypothetical protein PHMEG_00041617 [Phytophthora megakarya]|uniref:Eukaryotic/viral aspartic protease n=1 Tax=Phytophthora megakarya TaxID=4795 RepID=A0A225UBC8_9STRA|nr:hypothetical protein PHMEG_00041617 [Phytophthora megakarya]